jgi:hypothetical protein
MDQAQFAALVGLRPRDYRKYEDGERGARGISQLQYKLCDLTNVYAAWMCYGGTPKNWKGRVRKPITADNRPLRLGRPCYFFKVETDVLAPTLYPGDSVEVDPNEMPEAYEIGLVIPSDKDAKPFLVRMDHSAKYYFEPDEGHTSFSYTTLDGRVWNHPLTDVRAIYRCGSRWRPEPNANESGEIYRTCAGDNYWRTASMDTLRRIVKASKTHRHGVMAAKIIRSASGESHIMFKEGNFLCSSWAGTAQPITETEADEFVRLGATDERQPISMLVAAE